MTERATDQPEYTDETIDLCVGAGARLEGEFLQITDEETILPTTKNWVLMAVIMCNILDRLEMLEGWMKSELIVNEEDFEVGYDG